MIETRRTIDVGKALLFFVVAYIVAAGVVWGLAELLLVVMY